jgi:putative ABC transport system ATP-binding protein
MKTMTPSALISLHAVSKVYGSASPVTALDDVTLDIVPGELAMIMGPSGSGKTTLLSVMGCMLRPSSGTVRICGRDVTGLGEAELPRVRLNCIGFIFQAFNLFSTLTARGNIEIALELKGIRGAAARTRALDLLGRVGLREQANRTPAELSGGQKQRVAIARALATEAPIILADEPTAALDSESGHTVMQILGGLAHEQNRAVIIVTHDVRLQAFADRVLFMEDGRLHLPSHDSDTPRHRDTASDSLGASEPQCVVEGTI